MPKFKITPRARDDLINIGRYTERQWGKSQRNAYLHDFEERFRWLAENPRLGKHRSDVTEGYYSYPQGQHVIFYLIGQGGIEVIGIPHKEMDIVSYFLPD
jgi:toxin ParE1/3/4